MTTTEAANKLGVTRQRVIAMIRDGVLKAKKFGNAWDISRAAINSAKGRKPGRPKKNK